ncbi:MAG: hydrolase [Gammaproteobacteria bacterium]|nr:hydrolase [Gammaproteobacteria bacterium]MBT8133881.1 hydrolase [Gammaproteobacteria bacterium]NNJ48855.1 hydrolase [Gammaproteobacteria bacterium]
MGLADFKPAWWLRSPHLQTLWPVYFKKRYKLDLLTEQVELDDGDFIDLCWSKKDSEKTVLVLHGLEGSIDSHYINGIIHQLERAGCRPVLMHFRGCSGRINRLARAYHSGETGDLATIVEHIRKLTGHYPYAAIGYSLGGNVLLKWLGETAEKNPLKKAVAVSVPFHLHDAAARLQLGVSRIYREHLLKSLRNTYIEKFKRIRSPIDVDVKQLTSFWDYDDKVTAPLHGFDGAQDYYDRCSSKQFLNTIRVSTRIIHSLDDPFMFATTAPGDDELSPDIDLLLTSGGGHVGFVSGVSPLQPVYWCEERTVEFIADNQ